MYLILSSSCVLSCFVITIAASFIKGTCSLPTLLSLILFDLSRLPSLPFLSDACLRLPSDRLALGYGKGSV